MSWAITAASSAKPYRLNPAAMIELSCGQTEPLWYECGLYEGCSEESVRMPQPEFMSGASSRSTTRQPDAVKISFHDRIILCWIASCYVWPVDSLTSPQIGKQKREVSGVLTRPGDVDDRKYLTCQGRRDALKVAVSLVGLKRDTATKDGDDSYEDRRPSNHRSLEIVVLPTL